MASLTPKQEMFVKEYLIDLNATQAAIRAGYSERSAEVEGFRLLRNAKVAAFVQEAMDKRSERTLITADNVLNELAKLGFGNIRNLYDDTGRLIPLHELSADITATITEVTERVVASEGENVVMERKYKISDKRAALVDLGKHLKLFNEVGSKDNPLCLEKASMEELDAELARYAAKGLTENK